MLSKRNVGLIVLFAGLFLVVVALSGNINKSAVVPVGNNNGEVSMSPTPTPVKKAASTTPKSTLSYDEAFRQYQGHRVQFDQNCQAIPSTFTVKNGTAVMFDNRSGDSRWISLNGFGYYLEGYGFTIITLSSKNPPENVFIDCGSAQNVGQILVQQ